MTDTPRDATRPLITPEMVAAHGFKGDEYPRLLEILGREPTFLEARIFVPFEAVGGHHFGGDLGLFRVARRVGHGNPLMCSGGLYSG